jgi:hypothetical protein
MYITYCIFRKGLLNTWNIIYINILINLTKLPVFKVHNFFDFQGINSVYSIKFRDSVSKTITGSVSLQCHY